MKRHRPWPSVLVALVTGAMLATAGSLAWAAIPDAGGVFDGCVKESSGILRLIDSEVGESCLPTESGVSWSQTGPQGPSGPPGLSGVERVLGPEATVDSGTFSNDSTAVCPTGKKVLGGGWETVSAASNAADFLFVTDNAALTDGSWTVGLTLLTTTTSHREFRAVAICALVSS